MVQTMLWHNYESLYVSLLSRHWDKTVWDAETHAENVKKFALPCKSKSTWISRWFLLCKVKFCLWAQVLVSSEPSCKSSRITTHIFCCFCSKILYTRASVCRPRCQRQTGGCFGGWWALSKPWKKEPCDYWGREGVAETERRRSKQAKEQLCVVNKPCKISKEEVSTPASKE